MPAALQKSEGQVADGPLVNDGATLTGIVVKDTYVFSVAHDNADDVTAYEVTPASLESRLTGTAAVTLTEAASGWLTTITGIAAIDLSDVDDRGGIVWVRADDTIVGFCEDIGPADATYLPTWPDGLAFDDIQSYDDLLGRTVAGVAFDGTGDVPAADLAGVLEPLLPSGGATTLNDLTDVATTGATSGDALVFDGGGWVPGAGGTTFTPAAPLDLTAGSLSLQADPFTLPVVGGELTARKGAATVVESGGVIDVAAAYAATTAAVFVCVLTSISTDPAVDIVLPDPSACAPVVLIVTGGGPAVSTMADFTFSCPDAYGVFIDTSSADSSGSGIGIQVIPVDVGAASLAWGGNIQTERIRNASKVVVNASGFTGNLSPADDDVQAALATLDALDLGTLALGESSTTAYRGDRGKAAYDHSQIVTGNPHGTTAADVGAASSSHTHAASDITSGTLDIARIPTGTTSTTVPLGNDSRFSDARTPTAHKASHSTGGTDALAPSDIGAAPTSRSVSAGTGLSGGGDLSADRTLSVSYGTTSGTAAQGNDSRITGAIQSSTATTKGDLLIATASSTVTRLGVGADGTVPVASSNETTGVLWARPARPALYTAGGYTPLAAATTASGQTNNRLFYIPFFVPRRGTYDRIAINHTATTATTGGCRLGIYAIDSAGGVPGARISDYGVADLTTAAAVKEITISETLDPGVYFAAAVYQITGSNPSCTSAGVSQMSIALSTPGTAAGPLYYFENSVSGALPATATVSLASVATQAPLVWLRSV